MSEPVQRLYFRAAMVMIRAAVDESDSETEQVYLGTPNYTFYHRELIREVRKLEDKFPLLNKFVVPKAQDSVLRYAGGE